LNRARWRRVQRWLGGRVVQSLCRIFFGGMFILASLDKIAHPHDFAAIVFDYRLLPDAVVTTVALVLPWLELVAGLYLISGVFVKPAASILVALMMIFILALTISAVRGFDLDCGCFTTNADGAETSLLTLVFRDLVMLIPGLVILIFTPSSSRNHG